MSNPWISVDGRLPALHEQYGGNSEWVWTKNSRGEKRLNYLVGHSGEWPRPRGASGPFEVTHWAPANPPEDSDSVFSDNELAALNNLGGSPKLARKYQITEIAHSCGKDANAVLIGNLLHTQNEIRWLMGTQVVRFCPVCGWELPQNLDKMLFTDDPDYITLGDE